MDLLPNIPDRDQVQGAGRATARDGLAVSGCCTPTMSNSLSTDTRSVGDPNTLDMIVDALPQLRAISHRPGERVELVNGTIVEEIIQDLGELDFGGGHRAVVTIGLWRTRGEHRPRSVSCPTNSRRKAAATSPPSNPGAGALPGVLHPLQPEARDYVYLGATKTGLVYRLHGNPPNSHE